MIYTDIADTLAAARQHTSSRAQLYFLDHLILMLADSLDQYNKFNRDLFIEKSKRGHDLPLCTTTLE